jgi:hypothetical protein
VRIAALAEAGPQDKVFAVDPEAGTVTFGDGIHGRRPPPAGVIRATYHGGTGAAGDVVITLERRGGTAASDQIVWCAIRGSTCSITFTDGEFTAQSDHTSSATRE